MKKRISLLLICVLLLLTSCSSENETKTTIASDDALTQTYPLADLESYIKDRNAFTLVYFGEEYQPLLFYDELNEKFPVEVFEVSNKDYLDLAYTIYRVAEGGYYYVFWSQTSFSHEDPWSPMPPTDWSDTERTIVYHSIYLKSYKKVSDFADLKIGVSTAEDVIKVDPNLQFAFLSRGRTSCSLLNKDMALEIKYKQIDPENPLHDYSQLIVEKIDLVPIENTGSYFGAVSKDNMP